MFRLARLVLTCTIAVLVAGVTLTSPVPSVFAAAFNVCSTCTYTTIQAALNAAPSGSVVHIGAGTFAGGISVTKSVTIIGAGAGATVIAGGGPVMTIGTFLTPTEPTVSVSGVTITGGSNTSGRSDGAAGGGIDVVAAIGFTRGATVVIDSSVITANTVSPVAASLCGPYCLSSAGGGIANNGAMTLNDTTVSNNSSIWNAALVSDSGAGGGGGIVNFPDGALTMHGGTVTANTVSLATTNGFLRYGTGGGIESFGPLTIDGSTLTRNAVTVSNASTDPASTTVAIGGGVHIDGSAAATIRGSVIRDNTATVIGYAGFVASTAGGIDDDGSLQLSGSTVSNNRSAATVTSTLTSPTSQANGGAMEIEGAATITGTTFSGNDSSAASPAASFTTGGGNFVSGAIFIPGSRGVTMTESSVVGNSASGTTTSGDLLVAGGGISNCSGSVTLQDITVSNNVGTGSGPSGAVQGGGIWNGNSCGAAPSLTLLNSAVTHNSLKTSGGITPDGGGLYTVVPVVKINTVIAGNTPDQCFGC